jgi:pyruvate/2-oxoglutarate dehydrogenase complex dihydrolipoamide acyltransferase (E2) component
VIKPARFSVKPWPKLRDALLTFLESHRPHTYYGMTEADITPALRAIEGLRRDFRAAISLHAYVLYCLAQSARAHPQVLSYRKGRSILTFDDVDLATVVDRRLPSGARIPVTHILRNAESKSLAEINWELRRAGRMDPAQDETIKLRRRLLTLPAFLRALLRRKIFRDPLWLRRFYGTIGCTNLRVPGTERMGFAVPPNVFTLTVAVGWIYDRQVAGVEGVRSMLCITNSIDHAVIDGMAAALWAKDFSDRLESAAGLDETLVEEMRRLPGRTAQ